MSAMAVRLTFQQRRSFTPARTFHGLLRRRVHLLAIVAVNDHAWDAVGLRPLCKIIDRSGCADRRILPVKIVLDHEDDWGTPDARHVEGLVKGPDVGRPIA